MPHFRRLFRSALGLLLIGAAAAPAAHGQRRTDDASWRERCEDSGSRNRVTVCDVRELTLPASSGRLIVNARPNGSITVTGTDRRDVRLVARIQASARREADAREIVSEIEIRTDGEIRAEGPRTERDEGWSVSFVLEVPRTMDLALASTNGSISLAGVRGDLDLRTINGGLSLEAVAGSVRGRTTNGAIQVALDGDRWQGDGLDLQTTNGGVQLRIPERYNARLETGTTNGGLTFDFPVMVQGRISRRFSTDLGSGGALIRVTTTNGGVTVGRM